MIHTIIQRCRLRAVPAPAKPVPQPGGPRPAARSPRDRSPRGLLACRRGVVAVEFVLASVPLLMLCFGFIATSSIYNTWGNMQSNTQYAARMMSTGQVANNTNGAFSTSNASSSVSCSSSKVTSTTVEYYACTGLPTWATYTVTTTENCAVPSVTVGLSANASAAAIADVENFFAGKTINSQTVFMKEGSCP
jgi:Flp pilus assembly protein TadG